MDTWINDDNGLAYISCSVLCVGDYSGAGTIGEANIRTLEDREDAIVRHGYYSSRQLWLLDTEENRDLIEQLECRYPLIDDEEHSRVEMEWEEEAWENWLRDDLNRTLPGPLSEVVEDELADDHLWECYFVAMEKTNTYPVFEESGAHVDVKRIAAAYGETVLARLTRKWVQCLPDGLGRVVGDDLTDDDLQECCWAALEVGDASPQDTFTAAVLDRLARLA